jgi:hypothetical protein
MWVPRYMRCPDCGGYARFHQTCEDCGTFRCPCGWQVLIVDGLPLWRDESVGPPRRLHVLELFEDARRDPLPSPSPSIGAATLP